ncbi:MAG: NAD-dependent epimerase/dehydratase family protein, partial [Proteobacteria bacterium]|nr:NAD-dependent epimerase/dehydratase family protein [Pseudomonadota bacterium]
MAFDKAGATSAIAASIAAGLPVATACSMRWDAASTAPAAFAGVMTGDPPLERDSEPPDETVGSGRADTCTEASPALRAAALSARRSAASALTCRARSSARETRPTDLIALAYHHTHGTPVVVTRCTNNFGPYQYPEKAIPLFTTNLLDGKKIPLYGDGLNERDWLFV